MEEESSTETNKKEEVELEDVEALKQTLTEERARSEKNLANWQRVQADFINYKKRTDQEKSEIGCFANALLVSSLLPVLDDLERAFTALPDELSGLVWVDGIQLIQRKLKSILEAQGLAEIVAVGEPFSPALHEAVAYEEGGSEGIIKEELQRGYKLYSRVIRPSLVVVGKGKAGDKETEQEDNDKEENKWEEQ